MAGCRPSRCQPGQQFAVVHDAFGRAVVRRTCSTSCCCRIQAAAGSRGCSHIRLHRARSTAEAEHHGGGLERSLAEQHIRSAVAHVEPERNPAEIGLPVADGAGCTGLDAVTPGGMPVGCEEVPRHQPVADHAAPFEVAVGAFPVVAEVTPASPASSRSTADGCGRAELRALRPRCSSSEAFRRALQVRRYLDSRRRPAGSRTLEASGAGIGKNRYAVGLAQQVGEREDEEAAGLVCAAAGVAAAARRKVRRSMCFDCDAYEAASKFRISV